MASRLNFDADHPYDDDDDAHAESRFGDISAAEAALKAKLSRKRTKTGCLTCRKRRIKCGEERPVCKNCIKSKRHCDGYNQRVVFRPPTFEYHPAPNGGAHITFQAAAPIPGAQQPPPYHDSHAASIDPSASAPLQPHAFEDGHVNVYDLPRHQPPHFAGLGRAQPAFQHDHFADPAYESMSQPFHFAPSHQPVSYPGPNLYTQAQHVYQPPRAPDTPQQHLDAPGPRGDGLRQGPAVLHHDEQKPFPPREGMPPVTSLAHIYQQHPSQPPQPQEHRDSVHGHFQLQDQAWSDTKPAVKAEHDFFPTPVSCKSSRTLSFSQTPVTASQQQWAASGQMQQHGQTAPAEYARPVESTYGGWPQPHAPGSSQPAPADHTTPEYYEHESHATPNHTPTYMLTAAAVEAQDDEYYDVGSDEEVEGDAYADEQQGHEQQQQQQQQTLRRILAANHISSQGLLSRRYDTFLYEGILNHYRVEEVASPLKNPATARVFAHFISATGPSLSIFERHPRNTSVLFTEGSIPLSQQGLWTYRMPRAALRNQGLLHAMLAMASLHIARLQNASVTPSMQHYAWALRRIHASVGKPERRLQVTTIAATMLLGFYEIMTADHLKWNMHLAGSKQLFVETDFVKMTKGFRRLKRERHEKMMRHQAGRRRRHSSEELFSQDDLLDQIADVDERVISRLTGKEVRYDDHGSVGASYSGIPPALDLARFEILKDLYWWYCKQDVIQSIVSGNPLLMDFSRWANCPPRAPLGKGDAVYGTFDHLVLLLGRIADFSSRDRERKLKQMELNGGQWRPAPGMNIPRPPNQQQAPPPTPMSTTSNGMPGQAFPQAGQPTPGQVPAMPQFYGMAPAPRSNVHMPSSYTPSVSIPTPQSAHPPSAFDYDLEKETAAALQEYGRIRAALNLFEQSLGEAFEPLKSEYQPPMDTPFGTALFYRSYDIGCLWALYNMAQLIALRAHPHMPPAAHLAAAIAARETASYANQIGRIAAGIVPGPENQPLNPSLGAALCESCMPSFFAAVQYRDYEQRRATVTRIWSIAQRTGWGSAELIANGCETAWVKAAAAGRGPPWERIARPAEHRDDPRLNGSWEHLDPNLPPDDLNNDDDRRLVGSKPVVRLKWAIGVMGVEEDVERMIRVHGTGGTGIG
ncbi:transcriptional regulatory [Lecanosticta acicola]|uniref:Transcriptional regulatory n=1 Tax=Lecanosticta acicola TaxID=111012 RepID=A0AAI9ED75_9PEZI|nr:transcriptional regulatory [Lecanosticta acicola]